MSICSLPQGCVGSPRQFSQGRLGGRRLRGAALPELQDKLWRDHFWSPSGGAPLVVGKAYVQNQRGSSPP
jgi:hypothetical protein